MEEPRDIYLAYALCDCIEDKNMRHIIQLLENEKASPNTLLPEKDFTPLHYVVGYNSSWFAEETTKLFLQHGGDPNVRNSDGLTPVHVAACWGHADLLRLLLLSGGDPWLQDNESCSAFHYAVQESHWNVVDVIDHFPLKDVSLQQATDSCIQNPKYKVKLEKVILSNCDIVLECAVTNTIPETGSELKNSCLLSSSSYSDVCVGNNTVDNLELLSNENIKRHLQKQKNGVYSSGCSNLIFSDSSMSLKDASRAIECITLSSCETSDKDTNSKECISISSEQKSDTSSICCAPSNQKSVTEKCVSFEYMQSSLLSEKSFGQENSTKSRRNLLPCFSMNLSGNMTGCYFNSTTFDQQKLCANEPAEPISENMLHSVIYSLEKMTLDSRCDGTQGLTSSHSLSGRSLSLHQCLLSESSHSVLNEGFMGEDTRNGVHNTKSDTWHLSPGKYDEDSVVCNMFQSTPKKQLKVGTEGQLEINPNLKCEVVANIDTDSELSAGGITDGRNKSFQRVVSEDVSSKSDMRDICLEEKGDFGLSTKILEDNFFTCSSKSSSSSGSYFSVTEEYRYTDEENGIVLKELRILTDKCSIPEGVFDNVKNSVDSLSDSLSSSTLSSLELNLDYDTESLRVELKERNCIPGPITKTTKRLYVKKLVKLKKTGEFCNQEQRNPDYSPELECTLKTMEWVNGLAAYLTLEQEVAIQFSNPNSERRWRGGITKSAFCYLLLDPRVTKNLPCRTQTLEPLQIWQTFVSSIFYIGKGVRNRPYSHLYQAVSIWKTKSKSSDKKVQYILDIWSEGLGVVCLHVFQNVIPVEAHTREAAMIDAMGLKALKNARHSEYYGIATTWNSKQKRKLGVYLLYRALLVFLSEGERQIGPENL